MGSSLSVRNDLPFKIHVALCQVGPLHAIYDLEPGETRAITCGRVWFTVKVYCANDGNLKNINASASVVAIANFSSIIFDLVPNPYFRAIAAGLRVTEAAAVLVNHGNENLGLDVTLLMLAIASGFTGNIKSLRFKGKVSSAVLRSVYHLAIKVADLF